MQLKTNGKKLALTNFSLKYLATAQVKLNLKSNPLSLLNKQVSNLNYEA
jgi:hypothetical protein